MLFKLTTYIKSEVDSNLLLKSDKLTTYTNTEVDTLITNLIDAAPTVLNTLNELANALNDDANYAATIQKQLSLRQNIITNLTGTGQLLMENNYLKRIFTVAPLNIKTYLYK